jgi:arylsulfatase A-like enzyme
MQMPLLIKWKGKIKPGVVTNELIQNIDIAPTILDIAGQPTPPFMQGISFNTLMTGGTSSLPRKELYYRYYEYPIHHYVLPHVGIREQNFKLAYFHTVNEWEFYDLQRDPHEQENLINSPVYQDKIEAMKKRLGELKRHYKDTDPAGILRD